MENKLRINNRQILNKNNRKLNLEAISCSLRMSYWKNLDKFLKLTMCFPW